MLGATRVTPAVPNRMVHGYGLSPALVDELAALQPDLLVTVDHGIACHAGIAAAKALGWQVLVTDHHLPGESLPPADAIVNPNLRGDAFPSKMLAGVGVMFYVLLALRKKLRERGALATGRSRICPRCWIWSPSAPSPISCRWTSTIARWSAQACGGCAQGRACAGLRALIEVSGREAAATDRSRYRFRHRAAAQCGRTAGRHGHRHRMPAQRRCHPGRRAGAGAERHQCRASWRAAADGR